MPFKKLLLKNTGNFCVVDDFIFDMFNGLYLREHQGYAYAKFNGKSIPLHRIITMAPAGMCVDHINRNRLDNRARNLRLCTRQANTFNASIASSNSTGFKGVHFHKKNKRWVAYIGRKPKTYLGSFLNAVDAAMAYNKAAKIRYGKFAALNKLEEI